MEATKALSQSAQLFDWMGGSHVHDLYRGAFMDLALSVFVKQRRRFPSPIEETYHLERLAGRYDSFVICLN